MGTARGRGRVHEEVQVYPHRVLRCQPGCRKELVKVVDGLGAGDDYAAPVAMLSFVRTGIERIEWRQRAIGQLTLPRHDVDLMASGRRGVRRRRRAVAVQRGDAVRVPY